jgi:hypothetical protein
MVAEAMSNPDPVESAWKIHGILNDWTGKADAKASFALTIESASLGAVIAFSNKDRALGQISDPQLLWLYRIGTMVLSVAVLCAAAAVVPQIRGRLARRNWQDNFIYFGHLRSWNPRNLEEALLDMELLPVLTRQLVAMSKIAWIKYRLIQVSLVLAVLGALLITVSGVLA